MMISKLSLYLFAMTHNLLYKSISIQRKKSCPKRILSDCRKFPFCNLGLFWNRGEYPVFIYWIYLPCIPNGFGYRTQKQGGWCSVVRLLGLVLFLFVDWDIPELYPVLDSILLCFQVGIFALGNVTTNSWRKIPLWQFSERLFEEEFRPHVSHRYGNGRSQKVGRYDRFGACW